MEELDFLFPDKLYHRRLSKIKSAKIRTAKGAKYAGIVRYIDRKVGKGKTKVKGRKYYYKVRAFRKVNGKRVYGAYSKAAK